MPAALFGITNDGLNLFVNLLVLFLVVVWIALIAWTYLDARRRLTDPVLIACATGASVFPFVGSIVYSILRPPEFLEDIRERELEIRAAELRLRQLEEHSCPNCEFPVERSYLRCPNCKARISNPCEECGKPIDPRWDLCPYCETPVRRPEPPPRRAPAKRAAKAPEARKPRATRAPAQARKANAAPTRSGSASGRSATGRTARATEESPAAKGRQSRPSR
jgi:hypothetical protein